MSENRVLPLVPLRSLVAFPGTIITLDVGRDISKNAVEIAQKENHQLLLFTQKDTNVDLPSQEDLQPVGVLATIQQVQPMEKINGYKVTVMIEGRVELQSFTAASSHYYAAYELISDQYSIEEDRDEVVKSYETKLLSELSHFNKTTRMLSADQLGKIQRDTNLSNKLDAIAHLTVGRMEERYKILGELFLDKRVEMLLLHLVKENHHLDIEAEINRKVKETIDKTQKEYYLREKVKTIHEELGEGEDKDNTCNELREKINESLMPEEVKARALKEVQKLQRLTTMAPDYGNIQNYLEFLIGLPWGVYKENKENLAYAQRVLEADHYGLEKIKSRILEFLAVQQLKKESSGTILCLAGPPGVGKTSLARSIAKATNRDFVRMSLGGLQDVAEIRGHRRTYIGAIPGRIMQHISDAGSSNPLFLLDEIDKLNHDFKGDPASALLEALDPEQNSTFSDHYLEVPYDLSHVFFVTTANDLSTIPAPLRDRMEIIEMSSYTEHEKLKIAKKYLVAKAMKATGLTKEQISFTDGALMEIIRSYTRESGVRELERKIEAICRKIVKEYVLREDQVNTRIVKADVEKFLGKPRYAHQTTDNRDEVGVAVGMAWTPVGGEILHIESQKMPGKGNMRLTGQLGDVMKESAAIALSYLRSLSNKWNIDSNFFEEHDFHVHIPAGAVPKEGPSAGVTLTTSLLSMLLEMPLRKDVAMTGEMTLRGKVLAVGGIREKVMAAHRAGCKTIVMPKECERDLEELPEDIREALDIHCVERIEEVWRLAFKDEVPL